ncbi:MAG: outer membrane beta-barrel protein [Saprospiraceae bacterium]|nr:outer membrane beta-barrel protein [Saprospiraceae bacterium]
MNANYQAEPNTLQNIVEASAGFRLFKKKEIWIDAGVIGSPYTNESAISKDHLMYTRSLAPEYVPYYLSGIKFSIPINKKINLYAYLINGWQQIQDVNKGKAIGTQVEYRPNNLNLINWNVYIGDERSQVSPQNRMRYFTDVYWIYNPEGKFSITSCAYVGNQNRLLLQPSRITIGGRQTLYADIN